MKSSYRKLAYVALVLTCLGFAAFIFVKGKDTVVMPEFKERQGTGSNDPEWLSAKKRVDELYDKLTKKPDDTKTMLLVAKEFMQEGRVSGNSAYYNKQALEFSNKALALEPQNVDALCYKAMIYLSQHRFEEGRQVADQALKINPHYSFVYGLLVDANVELGDYEKAVEMADRMNTVRPDIRSYSRVSYLREIYGDMPGSIEAAQEAVKAGYAGNEDEAWTRMVLAHLFEDTNQLDLAREQYEYALSERPNYPFALAGIGKIYRYEKDYGKAITYFENARKLVSDPSFFEELVELYHLNNQPEKAEEMGKITINALLQDNITADMKDKDSGTYADRELAIFYLIMNQPKEALKHAQIEYDRRPKNIDAAETLAWAFYKNGEMAKALTLVATVLSTHSQNPEKLVKMGLIQVANGQKEAGKTNIQKGLSLKPYMNEELVKEAMAQSDIATTLVTSK